jgi:drug/metabolite transporter (DMT)-like permease
MDTVVRRRKVTAAVVAAIAAATTDVAYVALIIQQNATGPNPGVVPFLLVYIAAIAAAAVVSTVLIVNGRLDRADVVLIAAAAGSGALGFLGIFSIGLGLLITAGLLLLAAFGFEPHARRPGDWKAPLVGAVGAVAILVAGFTISGVFWGS